MSNSEELSCCRVEEVKLSTYRAKPRQLDANQLTPVILLHGVTSAKETWQDVIHEIADATGRKVYSFDARNHGDSDWSDTNTYEDMVDDMLNLMKRLGISKAILVGHSMGGKTAMYFALREPGKVEKLVIEDLSPKRSPLAVREHVYLYIELLREALKELPAGVKNLHDAKDFVANYVLEKTPQDQRNDRHGRYDKSVWPLDTTGDGFRWKANLSGLERAIGNRFGVTSEMEGFYEGPVLFLYGTKSPYNLSKDKDFILNLFPNAAFEAIEGAGHQLHLEYRDEFLKAIIPFLKGQLTD